MTIRGPIANLFEHDSGSKLQLLPRDGSLCCAFMASNTRGLPPSVYVCPTFDLCVVMEWRPVKRYCGKIELLQKVYVGMYGESLFFDNITHILEDC